MYQVPNTSRKNDSRDVDNAPLLKKNLTTSKQIHIVAKISSQPDRVHCCVALIKRGTRYQRRWTAVYSLRFRPLSRWSWRERRLWAEQLQDAGTEKQVRFHPHQYVFKSCHVWRVRFCMCVWEKRKKNQEFLLIFFVKTKLKLRKNQLFKWKKNCKSLAVKCVESPHHICGFMMVSDI